MPYPTQGEAPPQPHDALFQWTFSQRRHAAGLLKAALEPPLAEAIDFPTVRVRRASFVSSGLRRRHSDLVLSGRLRGTPGRFYALIEHQRKVQRLMVLRKGSYMMQLWERLVRDHPALAGLPPIFALLVHHSGTGWTAATTFQEIVTVNPELRRAVQPYIPCFQMRLIDLSEGKESHLDEQALTGLGKVVLWCLSVAGNDARLVGEIGKMGPALAEVARDPDATGALEALLRYLLATHRRLDVAKMTKLLAGAAGPEIEEVIVTELDEIERRGELRGERRGATQAARRIVLQLMTARFGAVPDDVVARVEAAGDAALTRWTLRVLTAKTPEDVIAGGKQPPPRRAPVPRKPASRTGARKTTTATKHRAKAARDS